MRMCPLFAFEGHFPKCKDTKSFSYSNYMNVFIICLVGWCLSQDLPLGWNINDAKDRKVLKQELEEGQGHQIMCRTVKCAFAKQRPFSKPFSGSDLNDAEDPVLKHSAKCKNTSCILIQLCSALQTPLSGKLNTYRKCVPKFPKVCFPLTKG